MHTNPTEMHKYGDFVGGGGGRKFCFRSFGCWSFHRCSSLHLIRPILVCIELHSLVWIIFSVWDNILCEETIFSMKKVYSLWKHYYHCIELTFSVKKLYSMCRTTLYVKKLHCLWRTVLSMKELRPMRRTTFSVQELHSVSTTLQE